MFRFCFPGAADGSAGGLGALLQQGNDQQDALQRQRPAFGVIPLAGRMGVSAASAGADGRRRQAGGERDVCVR